MLAASIVGLGLGCNAILGMEERELRRPGVGGGGGSTSTSTGGSGGAAAGGGSGGSPTTTSSGGATTTVTTAGGNGGGLPCPSSWLRDDFVDGSISAIWSPWGQGTYAEVSGRLRLGVTHAGDESGVSSVAPFDLTGCAVWAEVPVVFDAAVQGSVVMQVESQTGDDWVAFFVEQGALDATERWGGQTNNLDGTAYSQTAHRHWRIREGEGTIYFEFSSNGVDWNELTTSATRAWMTSARLTLMVGVWAEQTTERAAEFESVNLDP